MDKKRRNFIKMAPFGILLPGHILNEFSDDIKSIISEDDDSIPVNSKSDSQLMDMDELYRKAIIIDGLVIPRGWDEDSFKALDKSGYTGFSASLPTESLEMALKSLVDWQKRIRENPDKLIFAKTSSDFIQAKTENKAALLFGFQNATMIEDKIDNIDLLYDLGTRWIQLTYNQRNLLGDGCTERTNAGLSDFGIEVVNRMNELGIIVDLSHCGRQTTNDGIAFSKVGACFNHTMCESLYKNHPRAKTDEQIRAMANKGGVMGVICLGYMIGPDPGGQTTLEAYVDHIDHAVKVAGIDHVGVAADFAIQGIEANGATYENWYVPRLSSFKESYQVKWPPWIPELDKPDRYLQVAKVLDRRGYSTGDIEKILGQNWLRYFGEVLKS